MSKMLHAHKTVKLSEHPNNGAGDTCIRLNGGTHAPHGQKGALSCMAERL
eukprot:COSAG01_NODE_9238_length_2510_cov_2.340523_3_plen_50_part_00